jgi:haloacid dehalogenase-like hydrolase
MKMTSKARRLAVAAIPLLLLAQGCGDGETSSSTTSSTSTGAGGAGGSGGGTGGSTASSSASSGTGGSGGAMAAAPDLDPKLTWYGENRAALDKMIDDHGVNSMGYDAAKKPVAVFDWDNTVIKNDVGDLTTFWLLNHDKILQPPGKSWAFTSGYLTADARTALGAACDALAAPGMPLPTSTNAPCADEIYSVYFNGTTTGGKAAFAGWDYRRIEPAYAWAAQLLAGHTPAEITGFAQSAITAGVAAAVDATQKVGTQTANAYVRIYDQIKDLAGVLQKNGFDVWVVSASPQYFVEPFAAMLDIPSDHVVGIRLVLDSGKLTSNLQGCGPVPDGTNDGMGNVTGNSLITYIDGKRCWVNKAIYGNTTASAIDQNPDKAKRIVFGAGDSDTDVSFLRDATALKLVLNRNKKELMCNAYGNYGKSWLINPMFIEPKGQQAAAYPCSTTACKSMSGASVPCLDEGGVVIPDQADTVF